MDLGVQTRSKEKQQPPPDLIDTDILDTIEFPDLPVSLSSFFCLICDEQHQSEDQIRSHYISHLVDKSFECPDCAAVIDDLDLFLKHVDNCAPLPDLGQTSYTLHEIRPLQEVQVSSQQQNGSDYESHLSSNSNNKTSEEALDNEKYQCILCMASFSSKTEYKNHIEEHGTVFDDLKLRCKRGRKERPFKCELCSNSFSSSASLHLHKQKIHLGLNFEPECNENLQRQPQQTIDGPFVCALCQSRYPRKRDLKKHILSTHCVVPVQCKYCSKLFDFESRMLKHVQRHEGPSPVPCSICNIPYASLLELEKHKKGAHTPNKSHKCYCGKFVTKSNDLLKHTRIHLGIRPFSCSICSKSFTHQTSLRNHQAVHSGEKPFICSYCGAPFSYAGNLKVHIRSRHTSDRPFSCHFCNKTFARSANLNEHLRTHTQEKPHKCFCGKQFTSSSTLSKHKKTHSGVKNHACGVCNRRFTEMAHLSKHLMTHTGKFSINITL